MESAIVQIQVAIQTYATYTLETNKSKEEVIEDIKREGVDIIENGDYEFQEYEVNDEETVMDLSKKIWYTVDYEDVTI